MSPRRSPGKLRRPSQRPERPDPDAGERTTGPDGSEWLVRRITGSSSTKIYRCPGCDQEIRPATPHVVAWPDGALDERRHWHTPCWEARSRRSARPHR